MNPKATQHSLLFLLGFLSISAVFGGGALVISPSGKLLGGLPLSILRNSPFSSFLVLGIILFVILGICPGLLVVALLKKPASGLAERFNFCKDMHWCWSFTIYTAFALIIWIQVETIYIKGVGWLQTFYMLLAIPIIFIALLPDVRNRYKK